MPEEKISQDLTISNAQIFSVGAIRYMVPSDYLCLKDGVILQLWYDKHSFNHISYKEWRPLKSFEEASKEFNCDIVVGD